MHQLLEVQALSKIDGSRSTLDQVSLKVRAGELVGLFGRNGAGKSTLLRAIMGLVELTEGEILFRGELLNDLPVEDRSRRGLGYLSQESATFRGLTVEDNLVAVLETRSDSSLDRARHLMAEVGLSSRARDAASSLQGTERRLLQLARTLALQPALLLLDEPFSGMDPTRAAELSRLFRTLLARGIGILIADHNIAGTLDLCDRAYILHEGRMLKEGSPGEIREPSGPGTAA